jgi:hypothetical protein
MDQGIHVFGASSMGALRAAELAAFGMVGVGEIFEAYRDGVIEDDDEVAVVHGPPELGHMQISEAMVNIRATVRKATAAGVISPATAAALIESAKALFYKSRTYDRLLAAASARHLPADELTRLKAWLPKNQVNQKRLDAIAMLQAIKQARAAALPPARPSYLFEHTILWDAVERQFGVSGVDDLAVAVAAPRNGIFDELRLDAALYEQLRRKATVRALSRRAAADQGDDPTAAELTEAVRSFRKRMGFRSADELEGWLCARDLSRDDFMRLMADEVRRQRLDVTHAAAIDDALADELAVADVRIHLQARADEKHAVLAARGVEQPTPTEIGLSEVELIAWFVAESGRRPAAAEPGEIARQLGFLDKDDLLRAAAREYCYRAWKDS